MVIFLLRCNCGIVADSLIKVLPVVLLVYVWLIFVIPIYFMNMIGWYSNYRFFTNEFRLVYCWKVYNVNIHFFCVTNRNRNYILFTKLPWPGDSEGTVRSSSQAATGPPVYHTQRRLHTVPLIAERQAGKLWIPIFIVFGMTRSGIEPESTASVADALSTRPLIGFNDLLVLLSIQCYSNHC